jgi:GNAT superfamily N-acetyltransferase
MSPADCVIRTARGADRVDLARLSTQLGYPMSDGEAAARLSEIAGHPDHALFVAERGGRLAAWLQVSLPRIFESPRQAEIAGLVVDEGERGRGIGRALIAEAERWARASGCSALRVRSNVVRERAHDFYRREGFAEIKTQRVFEKRLEP